MGWFGRESREDFIRPSPEFLAHQKVQRAIEQSNDRASAAQQQRDEHANKHHSRKSHSGGHHNTHRARDTAATRWGFSRGNR